MLLVSYNVQQRGHEHVFLLCQAAAGCKPAAG
jgi:hypothetical protein